MHLPRRSLQFISSPPDYSIEGTIYKVILTVAAIRHSIKKTKMHLRKNIFWKIKIKYIYLDGLFNSSQVLQITQQRVWHIRWHRRMLQLSMVLERKKYTYNKTCWKIKMHLIGWSPQLVSSLSDYSMEGMTYWSKRMQQFGATLDSKVIKQTF